MERRLVVVAMAVMLSSRLRDVVRDGGGRAGNSRSPARSDISTQLCGRESGSVESEVEGGGMSNWGSSSSKFLMHRPAAQVTS